MAKHRQISKQNNKKQKKIPKSRLAKTDELYGSFNEQTLSRKEREIVRLTNLAKEDDINNKVKRKRNSKNRLLQETAKLGYFQKPWEDNDQLVHRISRDSRHAVEGELLKAKYGAAGRNVKEIAQDYKELDAKEARKKLQKKAERENLNKAKAAKKALQLKKNQMRMIKKKNLDNLANEDVDMGDELQMSDESEMDDFQHSDSDEHKNDGDVKKKSELQIPVIKKKGKKAKDSSDHKRLGKNEKLRLKKKELREEEDREFLFNAREIIPFGERVDGPPQFIGKFRDSINQARAQAGNMNLLLKEKLKSSESKLEASTTYLPDQAACKSDNQDRDLAKERQRIIDAYRNRRK